VAAKRFIARAPAGGIRWYAMTSALLVGVVLWLCLGSGSALAGNRAGARGSASGPSGSALRAVAARSVPKFGLENSATGLCGSSGSGAPGTEVKQQSCSEYDNHDGNYQEWWATADLTPGVHLETFHRYNNQTMCLTIKHGELEVGTPLIVEPCGSSIALGQGFDELGAVGGILLRAYAESGRRVDDPLKLSDYCVASNGGGGTALVLQRCNNRLARQSWLGVTDEGSPGLPGPGPGE
jgi:hypothetical protein